MLEVLSTVQPITHRMVIKILMSTVPVILNAYGDIIISGSNVFAVFPSGHLKAMSLCL